MFVKGICLFLWGVLGYGGVKLAYPLFERFLADISSIQDNYQGKKTLIGTGLVIYFVCFSIGGWQWLFVTETFSRQFLPWLLFGSTIAAFVGWLDDQHGGQHIKGLRGHIAVFCRQGKLTTGFLKGFVLSIASGIITLPFSKGVGDWFFQAILLLLSINTLNLLDVRPGRAMKGFWFSLSAVTPFSMGWTQWEIWMPYLGAVLAIHRFDLQARSMLGDTGSNLLGMVLGIWLLAMQPEWVKVLFLVLFIGLHSLAEVSSISRVIERVPLLRWVDRWGRQN